MKESGTGNGTNFIPVRVIFPPLIYITGHISMRSYFNKTFNFRPSKRQKCENTKGSNFICKLQEKNYKRKCDSGWDLRQWGNDEESGFKMTNNLKN